MISPKDALISVIFPIYGVEKYIYHSVTSFINQTYKNLELILVDDGSPDRCPQICDDLASIDSRIKVIHKINEGLSIARNTGIDNANGDFIMFADPDDYVHSNMVELLYTLLIQNDADIAICNYKKVYNLTEPITTDIAAFNTNIWNGLEACQKIYDDLLCLRMTVVWNKLYKRTVIKDFRFPPHKKNEDEAFSYKVLFYASKVVYADIPLYFYHQTQDSSMRSGFDLTYIDSLDHFEERIEFMHQNGNDWMYMRALQQFCNQCMYCYTRLEKFDNSQTEIKENIKQRFHHIYKNHKHSMKLDRHCKIKYYLFDRCYVLFKVISYLKTK